MAPSRGTWFILTAFFLSSLVLFTLTYGRAHVALLAFPQVPAQGSKNGHDSSAEDFAIALHPVEYAFREPKILSHHWAVTKGYRSPDGVRKLVYLINGMFVRSLP
jgi:hypothetical protein